MEINSDYLNAEISGLENAWIDDKTHPFREDRNEKTLDEMFDLLRQAQEALSEWESTETRADRLEEDLDTMQKEMVELLEWLALQERLCTDEIGNRDEFLDQLPDVIRDTAFETGVKIEGYSTPLRRKRK